MARPRPPLLNGEVFIGGAPVRPRWCARATPFRNAQDKDTTNPHGGGGAPARRQQNSLNEGYVGISLFRAKPVVVDDDKWRIGGWNRWVSMITMIVGAWMLNGAKEIACIH
ncbi:hypothetical protein PIB30_054356 [Stylosanthes scabra]|uniref:Uncharacterized protein n=1 Tax=Stylosanthes scabra TaxID=79078 RepID=A0ABU6XGZ9_9FABA|nr:hypothetical protein [Stylosanthes scabra]